MNSLFHPVHRRITVQPICSVMRIQCWICCYPWIPQKWVVLTAFLLKCWKTLLQVFINLWLRLPIHQFPLDKYLCSLLDFQKAFDSVPHIPLIKKLQCIRMDLDEHLILWTKNYLSQRIQSVAVDGVTSSPRPVIFDVPQGSVLGPLLFLIYFTTISLSPLSRCVLYANDVLLYRLVTSPQDTRARGTRPGL